MIKTNSHNKIVQFGSFFSDVSYSDTSIDNIVHIKSNWIAGGDVKYKHVFSNSSEALFYYKHLIHLNHKPIKMKDGHHAQKRPSLLGISYDFFVSSNELLDYIINKSHLSMWLHAIHDIVKGNEGCWAQNGVLDQAFKSVFHATDFDKYKHLESLLEKHCQASPPKSSDIKLFSHILHDVIMEDAFSTNIIIVMQHLFKFPSSICGSNSLLFGNCLPSDIYLPSLEKLGEDILLSGLVIESMKLKPDMIVLSNSKQDIPLYYMHYINDRLVKVIKGSIPVDVEVQRTPKLSQYLDVDMSGLMQHVMETSDEQVAKDIHTRNGIVRGLLLTSDFVGQVKQDKVLEKDELRKWMEDYHSKSKCAIEFSVVDTSNSETLWFEIGDVDHGDVDSCVATVKWNLELMKLAIQYKS
ncbi:hypothetical protein AKO1_001442 [Acrasis kona]